MLVTLFSLIFSMAVQAAPTPVTFSNACEGVDQIVIGAVGDLLIAQPLHQKAEIQKSFAPQWQQFAPYIKSADIMYANLETPIAYGIKANLQEVPDPGFKWERGGVYTNFPMFNVHKTLLHNIREAGFDLVSTANNHSLDRGTVGISRTIEALEEVGLPFTGTKRSGERRAWHTIIEKNGFKTAWLACSDIWNIPDRRGEVLDCSRNKSEILDLIGQLRNEVDAVVVTPHWGVEGAAQPHPTQVHLGRDFLEAGAAMVLGAHPHVVQPMQKYITRDGRETFIIYSLANFISYQPQTRNKTTIMLFVGLSKNAQGQTFINGVRYIPAYMKSYTGNRMDIELFPIIKGQPRGEDHQGLAYLNTVISEENVLKYGDPLITNPECGGSQIQKLDQQKLWSR